MTRSLTLALVALLALSACIESPEERTARESQFNGKTVAQVEARIGPVNERGANYAVWRYYSDHTRTEPIYGFMNGQQRVMGYRDVRVTNQCTFTATLANGRITASRYDGNDCLRFAPNLDG